MLTTLGHSDNPELRKIIDSEKTFYLEPIFKPTCATDLGKASIGEHRVIRLCKTHSPYYLVAPVLLPSGQQLKIDAGVTIKSNRLPLTLIGSELVVDGTELEPVVIEQADILISGKVGAPGVLDARWLEIEGRITVGGGPLDEDGECDAAALTNSMVSGEMAIQRICSGNFTSTDIVVLPVPSFYSSVINGKIDALDAITYMLEKWYISWSLGEY